ncbi:MAG: Acetylornithine deacetylase/Succinyl-diaminopimelate desuccinylase and related deacylase [Firmicutes bacterium]|nr:Acetylornithine deacetylase/Succinyl-diaminopimelate desuccinylase and related deacylase [Bacillota bacterium]
MQKFFEKVDQNLNRMVQEVIEICRQPSIAAQNIGMIETADMIVAKMNLLGIKTQKMPVENGNPVIYGEITGASDKTVLFYDHYDVQPPEPLDQWISPPFEPEIRDGKIFARGISDNKGPLYTRLHAIETIMELTSNLPVNVKFLIEGEEEIGSPNLESFVKAHKELLKADVCVWENAHKAEDDHPVIRLGNKGMLYVELRVKAANTDYHSRFAPIIPNAAWRLIWALGTLKDANENILIKGFYDRIRPIPQEEYDALGAMAGQEEKIKKRAQIKELLNGVEGVEFANKFLNGPTCTVCGLSSGYTGQGSKTVLPCYAMAKLDFRMVVGQDPHEILTLLRKHLDEHGFTDIEIHPHSMAKPSKTPITDPVVKIAVEAGQLVYDKSFIIEPCAAGTGPRYVFSDWTNMPIIGIGPGYPGALNHAPNENLVIRDYCQAVKHIIAFLYKMAE